MSKIHYLLLISVFIFCGCATVSEEDQATAQLHWQLGSSLYAEGEYPSALKELLVAEKLDPKNPMVQNSLGLVYFARSRQQTAEEKFRKAITLDPKFTDARNNLGRIYIEQKKYDEALAELKIASADLTYASPEKPLFNMGYLFFVKKKYDEAIRYFKKSIEFQRESCDSQNFLGRSLYEQQKYLSAATALDKAVSICQSQMNDEPHYYAGLSYLKRMDLPRARARFTEVIKLYPDGKYVQAAKDHLRKM